MVFGQKEYEFEFVSWRAAVPRSSGEFGVLDFFWRMKCFDGEGLRFAFWLGLDHSLDTQALHKRDYVYVPIFVCCRQKFLP